MPDIFLSYSSRDRPVAERVRDALVDAGYDVFWDQNTPPGQDWDSWIRERLVGSRLVVVLWSKTSVASPNVRHEAIIAREAGQLLPLMVDDLAPTDFPMGLFLVQALKVGRGVREFEGARELLLGEVSARLGKSDRAKPRPAPKKSARAVTVAAVVAALIALAAALLWSGLLRTEDRSEALVSDAEIGAALASEGLARERVARGAESALSGDQELIGTTWAWAAGQLIAGAPDEAGELGDRFFAYLATVERPECGCYYSYDVPHSVANAWVVLASARLGRPAPGRLVETILEAQHPEGWWTISLNGVREPANAAVHPTALLTIALAEARRAGIVPQPLRPRVDRALRRSATWLNRGPETGERWTDYPNHERRTEHQVFAAMAAVATRIAGGGGSEMAAAAFARSASELPPPVLQFASGAYIDLEDGQRFFDAYRHPASPWIGAAATMLHAQSNPEQGRTLRRIAREWLEADLSDENLLRQDWIAAETLFLRSLAFRELAATP